MYVTLSSFLKVEISYIKICVTLVVPNPGLVFIRHIVE